MTLMYGQQCGTDCDPCCECGAWCTGGYCGKLMRFWARLRNASNGDMPTQACICTDLNGVFAMLFNSSATYDAFNANRTSFFETYGVQLAAFPAKEGTRACTWTTVDVVNSACDTGGIAIQVQSLSIYFGTDDKWHICGFVERLDSFAFEKFVFDSTLDGGDGAPIDCGTPGEETPTYVLEISLTKIPAANFGGTDDENQCRSPTAVRIEGNPQAAA